MGNNIPKFSLWLETEIGDILHPANRPQKNFCNIKITLEDGRRYALNVWTFDFLPFARYPWPYQVDDSLEPAKYVFPPDLFVENLERSTIEEVITELLKNDEMKEDWLCKNDK